MACADMSLKQVVTFFIPAVQGCVLFCSSTAISPSNPPKNLLDSIARENAASYLLHFEMWTGMFKEVIGEM